MALARARPVPRQGSIERFRFGTILPVRIVDELVGTQFSFVAPGTFVFTGANAVPNQFGKTVKARLSGML